MPLPSRHIIRSILISISAKHLKDAKSNGYPKAPLTPTPEQQMPPHIVNLNNQINKYMANQLAALAQPSHESDEDAWSDDNLVIDEGPAPDYADKVQGK